eukprot:153904-Pyramimonas_sp.AAC.1
MTWSANESQQYERVSAHEPGASWGFMKPPGASWGLKEPLGASWGFERPPEAPWSLAWPPGASWSLLGPSREESCPKRGPIYRNRRT